MSSEDHHLSRPRTRLFPLIEQRIAKEERIVMNLVQAWRLLHVKGLSVTDYYGKPVSYKGVTFEGSPRTVFWSGFFEPFLVGATTKSLEWIIDLCRERHLDPPEYLVETRELLRLLVEETYDAMVRTDQLLRGNGYPDSVQPVRVSLKVRAMYEQIDDLILALTHRGKEKPLSNESKDEIFQIRPNVRGIGIDLKALWKRLRGKAT